MKSALVIFLLLSCLLPPSASAEVSIKEILEGVKENYGSLQGLSVPYERDVVTRSMAMLDDDLKSDRATGLIYFKPPGLLKVEQKTPSAEEVVTDGNTLWWYIPQKREVYRYPSNRLGPELRLLGDVFRGLREVEEKFEIAAGGNGPEGCDQIMLIPAPPWPEIDYIAVSVTRVDRRIRVIQIHNYLGGFTRFLLGDHTPREDLKDSFFLFSVPEGVRVIEGE